MSFTKRRICSMLAPLACIAFLLASGICHAVSNDPSLPAELAASAVARKIARPHDPSEPVSDDHTDCPTNGPQRNLIDCMGKESSVLQVRIDRYVRLGIRRINQDVEATPAGRASGRQAFVAAQTSWVAYRDHACAAEYWMTDGTGAGLDEIACVEKMDRRRIRELREFLGEP